MPWTLRWVRRMEIAALALLAASVPRPVLAERPVRASVEVGLGFATVASQATLDGTLCAGLSTSLRGPLRVAVEFAATSGSGIIPVSYIPEGPIPGDRSLTTFLLGIEAWGSRDAHGPFAFLGLGVMHSTLSGARGNWADYPNNAIPPRNEMLPALGAGIGYRLAGGPGPFQLQVALRTHAAAREGETPSHTSALTLGVAY